MDLPHVQALRYPIWQCLRTPVDLQGGMIDGADTPSMNRRFGTISKNGVLNAVIYSPISTRSNYVPIYKDFLCKLWLNERIS